MAKKWIKDKAGTKEAAEAPTQDSGEKKSGADETGTKKKTAKEVRAKFYGSKE